MLSVLLCASYARADQISTFTISGTDVTACLLIGFGTPIPGCVPTPGQFTGSLMVDETTGANLSMDVSFVNSFNFDNNPFPGGLGLDGCLAQYSLPAQAALFLCINPPTPGSSSLAGFDGSSITGGEVSDNSNVPYVFITGGSITPVVSTSEPSSLALIAIGLGALLVMWTRMIRPSAV